MNIEKSTLKLIKDRAEEERKKVYSIRVQKEGRNALLIFDPTAHQAYKEVDKLCSIKYNAQGSYARWAEKTISLSKRVSYGDEIVYSIPWWSLRGLIHYYKNKGYTLILPQVFREVKE
ncbi:MAG: hypothetical protein GWO20_15255, partial [Candidatus Korarchaeota archaeon]|nr:hypothetical protein [Candidatus Korarchaeota archaeon]